MPFFFPITYKYLNERLFGLQSEARRAEYISAPKGYGIASWKGRYSIPPSVFTSLLYLTFCQSSCDLVSQVGNRKTEAERLVWDQREQEHLCVSKRVLPFHSCGVHLHQGMGQGKVRRTKVLFGTTSDNSRTACIYTIW